MKSDTHYHHSWQSCALPDVEVTPTERTGDKANKLIPINIAKCVREGPSQQQEQLVLVPIQTRTMTAPLILAVSGVPVGR